MLTTSPRRPPRTGPPQAVGGDRPAVDAEPEKERVRDREEAGHAGEQVPGLPEGDVHQRDDRDVEHPPVGRHRKQERRGQKEEVQDDFFVDFKFGLGSL